MAKDRTLVLKQRMGYYQFFTRNTFCFSFSVITRQDTRYNFGPYHTIRYLLSQVQAYAARNRASSIEYDMSQRLPGDIVLSSYLAWYFQTVFGHQFRIRHYFFSVTISDNSAFIEQNSSFGKCDCKIHIARRYY